ncbi:MAG: hypothetical protein IPK94_18045 [Saprospiraceae bacterium]|nr:hypothetical protein [Saprospiraceae bacterium]
MTKLIYTGIALIILSSCAPSLSPYTQKLYDRYEWKEADLKKVQFYLSDDIVLRRKAGSGKAEINQGQIKVIDGTRYEIVKFKRGTPGVLLFMPKENRMAISFEEGKANDANYLMFGPNPTVNNQYVLLAADWDKRSGEVTYQGKKWETSSHSAFAGLEINLKNIDQNNTEARVAKGRTVE